jgi:hypothetical protein
LMRSVADPRVLSALESEELMDRRVPRHGAGPSFRL